MECSRKLRLVSALAIMSNGINASIVSFTTEISPALRNLQLDSIDTSTPSYPQELSCTDSFTGFLDLTYTYTMESDLDYDIYPIIDNIEGEILLKLADAVLPCIQKQANLAFDIHFDEDHPFDRNSLGIVAINSKPPDNPSVITKCVSVSDTCTVVHGSLTVFITNDANLDYVRYASRYVINQAMKSNLFLTPRIRNLLSISYKGPRLVLPEAEPPSLSESVSPNKGMDVMTKVVIGALFSAIVGIVAGFVLFKKVFNSQNCFSNCDGTGVDRAYIEEAHFYSPSRLRDDRSGASVNEEDMAVVSYDIANGLSVINEDSDVMSSANASFAMSTMTGHSSNFGRFTAGEADASSWNTDSRSIHSEKTIPRSNKNRTPAFGTDETTHII